MAPILVDSTTTDQPKFLTSQKQLKRLKPWADDYDPATGVVTWNKPQTDALKAVILSSVNKNDAILHAAGGDLRTAIRNGYILIETYGDGMPNWGDIRKVVGLQGTGVQVALIGAAPKEVLMPVIQALNDEGKLKTVQPTQSKA